jgi:hypothetical protein
MTPRILTSTIVAAGLALAGCESHPKATGAGVGAAAGAGVGAGVGEVAADSPGVGAAVGAGLGALGGYVAADQLEKEEGRDYPDNYHRHGDFEHIHEHDGPHTHEQDREE